MCYKVSWCVTFEAYEETTAMACFDTARVVDICNVASAIMQMCQYERTISRFVF